MSQAQNNLQQQKEAMRYYRVIAPASGTIQSVLIRDGEYNQGAGSPGFVIASGLWFEANLDQQAMAEVHEGMEATRQPGGLRRTHFPRYRGTRSFRS